MDAFLVKNRDEGASTSTTSQTINGPKTQQTLLDLKRVIVMEDLQKYKEILSNPVAHSHVAVIECLSVLLSKLPSADILRKTKLGRIVKKLNSHNNQEIAVLSRKIVGIWSQDIRKRSNRKLLDVKCDLKTKTNRETARRLLSEALHNRIVSKKVEPFIYLDETINITNQRLTAEIRLIQQKFDKLSKMSTESSSFVWRVIAMLLGALVIKQMYDQYP